MGKQWESRSSEAAVGMTEEDEDDQTIQLGYNVHLCWAWHRVMLVRCLENVSNDFVDLIIL